MHKLFSRHNCKRDALSLVGLLGELQYPHMNVMLGWEFFTKSISEWDVFQIEVKYTVNTISQCYSHVPSCRKEYSFLCSPLDPVNSTLYRRINLSPLLAETSVDVEGNLVEAKMARMVIDLPRVEWITDKGGYFFTITTLEPLAFFQWVKQQFFKRFLQKLQMHLLQNGPLWIACGCEQLISLSGDTSSFRYLWYSRIIKIHQIRPQVVFLVASPIRCGRAECGQGHCKVGWFLYFAPPFSQIVVLPYHYTPNPELLQSCPRKN